MPVVEFLLEQKANVDAEDKHHNTALLRGARYPDVVRSLLAHKANARQENSAGDTALHTAAEGMSEASCQLLLAAGADPNSKNSDGRTPAQIGGAALAHVFK